MQDKTVIGIVAIISILIMECIALALGFNGTGLFLALSGVSGIGGYSIKGAKDVVINRKG